MPLRFISSDLCLGLVVAVHCVLLPFPSAQQFSQLQLGQRCPHARLLLLLLFFVSVTEKKKKSTGHTVYCWQNWRPTSQLSRSPSWYHGEKVPCWIAVDALTLDINTNAYLINDLSTIWFPTWSNHHHLRRLSCQCCCSSGHSDHKSSAGQ